jgi:hypothetical protein
MVNGGILVPFYCYICDIFKCVNVLIFVGVQYLHYILYNPILMSCIQYVLCVSRFWSVIRYTLNMLIIPSFEFSALFNIYIYIYIYI